MKRIVLFCVALVLAAAGQQWTGPFQLTDSAGDNTNPSAIREWVNGTATRLVWQSNRNGNWDIFSRLCRMQNGNGWEAEMPVFVGPGDDVTPVVVARFDVMQSWVYWCVWEMYESPSAGKIMAASATAFDTAWSAPVEVARCLHSAGDSARPSLMVIENPSADTVWAAWSEHDTDGYSIRYSYTTRTTWTPPAVAHTSSNPIRHVRLGRGESGGVPCPMLVWEAGSDIWYSRYVSGGWAAPVMIQQWASFNRNPEIISFSGYPFPTGPAIVWESTLDGDTAIYGAHGAGFDSVSRWCDSAPAGSNYTPCGTPAMYTTFGNPFWALPVWASDRNGNMDIYCRSLMEPEGDGLVDDDPADDINPTLTTIGVTQNWCVWQSNRDGNWDLFASTMYVTGVEEEGMKDEGGGMKPEQTILSASGVRRLASSVVFDAMGRRVLDPKPGVYFVRNDGRWTKNESTTMRKVILQR